MTAQQFRTLAYTKSPKASRRTTFQDELEAAVSARTSKTNADQYFFSDDFNEDDDDLFKELLTSRKKKSSAFKAGKSKAKINDFELSDDEGKSGRPKRVSFLKTQRVSVPLQDVMTSDSHENELPNSSINECSNQNSSFHSQHSRPFSEEDNRSIVSEKSGGDSTPPESTGKIPSESMTYRTSGSSQLDTPLPLPSDIGVIETPGPLFSECSAERNDSFHGEGQKTHTPQSMTTGLMSSTDSVIEREPPRPKPRQRTFGLNFHTMEERAENTGSQDLSRPPTSSVSIPLSNDTASHITTVSSPDRTTPRSCSAHRTEGGLSKAFSLVRTEQSPSFTKSTVDSGSRDGLNSDDSKEQEGKYSTSFEEFHEDSEDHSDHSIGRLKKSFATRTSRSLTKSSQRSQTVCSSKVESKYMGTLKVLDRKVPLEEPQPQAADSLRAAIYQEWLKKKNEKLRENMQLQKQEETLKEDKTKKDQQSKKEDAIASYEAWKEKKAESLKAKAKEKQDMIRKEQRAIEEREEKRESAKRVFEKWKQEHDEVLQEKYRKQREAENKLKLKKQETEEERQINSKSAFSNWDEEKKNVLNDKVMMERRKNKNTAKEERYRKEERDQMALETYEKWLKRKELEQRRHREERRIQAILQNSPPPPWSPPNKTIPFRK